MANEYIDRKIVIDLMEEAEFEIDCEENPDPVAWIETVISTMLYCVRATPTADVAPVAHGYWIDNGDYVTTAYSSLTVKECSVCNCAITIDEFDDFCPNCGAKMDGDKG